MAQNGEDRLEMRLFDLVRLFVVVDFAVLPFRRMVAAEVRIAVFLSAATKSAFGADRLQAKRMGRAARREWLR